MKLLPSYKEYPEGRLFCLDILRGLDMFYLAALSMVLRPLFTALGWNDALTFCCTHPWGGSNLYDQIMPLFIFMCGAAIPFALPKRLENGRAGWKFWKHVLWRVVMLYVIGVLAQGNLNEFNPMVLNPWHNTLHSIAIGYLATAALLLLPARLLWLRRLMPFALALAYTVFLGWSGDYSEWGNAAVKTDAIVYQWLLPAGNVAWKSQYTWWSTSAMFIAMTLFGMQATEILLANGSQWKRAALLGAYGLLMLGGGLLLELWIPCIKQIFTASFTFQAVGWDMLALAVLFVLTDIWKLRKGTGLILLFGQYALAAYLCESIFTKACYAAGGRVFGGLTRFVAPAYAPVLQSLFYSAVVVIVLIVWRGYKTARATR